MVNHKPFAAVAAVVLVAAVGACAQGPDRTDVRSDAGVTQAVGSGGYTRVVERLDMMPPDLVLEPPGADEAPSASIAAVIANAKATPSEAGVWKKDPTVYFGVYNGTISTAIGEDPPRRLVLVALFENVQVQRIGSPAGAEQAAEANSGDVAVMYDSRTGERIAVVTHAY